VAAASGTRVERIMRFAHPVLQERARVAEQAQEARVRLSEGTPGTTLQRFMTDRLRLLDTDLDAVQWDAHRNDEGAWLVTGEWRAGDKSGTTRWTFDVPARIVTPYDAATTDFAEGTRLVRVVPDVPVHLTGAPVQRSRPVTMLRDSGRAETAARPTPEAGEDHEDQHRDALPPTDSHATDVLDDPLPAALDDDVRDVHPPTGTVERSAEALLDEVADHDTVVLARPEGDTDPDDPRARIPAWEDIVFGVRRHR
jgi:hypothetical protein